MEAARLTFKSHGAAESESSGSEAESDCPISGNKDISPSRRLI